MQVGLLNRNSEQDPSKLGNSGESIPGQSGVNKSFRPLPILPDAGKNIMFIYVASVKLSKIQQRG